ncbi:MAG: hypothetical protein ACFE8L_08975 [Candidatus Hodarchaeota archaeon]
MDKQDKDILKLSRLLKHWADHNESHKESFLKWRDIARNKDLDSIVDKLDIAIDMIDSCNEYLLAAYKELEYNIQLK